MPQILHPSDKELVELGFEDELDLGNWNFRPY
jgi:hypothetical protein